MTTRSSILLWAAGAALAGGAPSQASGQATSTAAAPQVLEDSWRFTAAVGAWTSRNAMIIAPSGSNTTLTGGAAFTVDLSYDVTRRAAFYGGGLVAFSSVLPGAGLQVGTAGSERVTVLGGTAGVLLAVPGGLLGRFEPTVRVGGGMKGYRFDLGGSANQWRPMGDFGLGLRGAPGGPLDVHIEARYLASTVDQGKLPTRSIVPQVQRQGDLLLTVGLSLRP
jgi:hypothetical protein